MERLPKMIPKWTIKTLQKFGNCALPKSCESQDRKELEKELSKAVGFKVIVRQAIMTYQFDKKKTYLIAEAKR